VNLPHWQSDFHHIQSHKYDTPGLYSVVHLSPKSSAYDLLSKMLEYDPRKRISAAQALEHEYFRMEPLPGRNSLVPPQSGEKVVNYPIRPVDTTTDFEGTTSLQSSQSASSGNQVISGGMVGGHVLPNRNMPPTRPMQMVGMQQQQRMQPPPQAGMAAAYNLAAASQAAAAAAAAGMNPMQQQRGAVTQAQAQAQAQAHQQQLRRKDPGGMGMPGYPPQQKSRRF